MMKSKLLKQIQLFLKRTQLLKIKHQLTRRQIEARIWKTFHLVSMSLKLIKNKWNWKQPKLRLKKIKWEKDLFSTHKNLAHNMVNRSCWKMICLWKQPPRDNKLYRIKSRIKRQQAHWDTINLTIHWKAKGLCLSSIRRACKAGRNRKIGKMVLITWVVIKKIYRETHTLEENSTNLRSKSRMMKNEDARKREPTEAHMILKSPEIHLSTSQWTIKWINWV